MLLFLKNKLYLTIAFFVVLVVDIIIKTTVVNSIPFRFFTKLLLVPILGLYFFNFRNKKNDFNKYFIAGLVFFWLGDLFLLFYENTNSFLTGLLFFTIGKFFYSKKFSHQKDFKMARLLPFLALTFIYIITIALCVVDYLGDFLVPTLFYLFAAMLVAMFAFLRQYSVNKTSFYLVMLGILFSVVSDTISVLELFYSPGIPYSKILIMLFYGLFQYFVVFGLTKEEFID